MNNIHGTHTHKQTNKEFLSTLNDFVNIYPEKEKKMNIKTKIDRRKKKQTNKTTFLDVLVLVNNDDYSYGLLNMLFISLSDTRVCKKFKLESKKQKQENTVR